MNIYRNVKQLNNTRYSSKLFFPCPSDSPSEGTTCSRPVMVICETVNICSNDCIICPYGTMTRKKEVMSLELFEKLLQDYSAMGGGKLSLTPKTGDIFFDTQLLKRLDLIKKYPKITGISVTTNAIASDRFTDRELRDIISSFERVHISVYGLDPEEYSLMTRRDTYQRMVDNIRRILAISPRSGTITLGFRLLRERSPAEIYAWLLKNFPEEYSVMTRRDTYQRMVDNIHHILAISPRSGTVTLGFRLLRERSPAEIYAWLLKNFLVKIPYDVTSTFMDWGGSLDATRPLPLSGRWRPARENASQCVIPLAACLVFSSGDVSFCSCNDHAIKEEFRLGNIAKKSLSEIINSPKNAKLWESPLNLPRSCAFCSSHRAFTNLHTYAYLFEDPLKFIGG